MCWCWWKGTPSALKNPSEETWATDETTSRRKSTPGDASMRRSIQDLVVSIDPNIKIEPEVEDVRQLLCSRWLSRIRFVYPLSLALAPSTIVVQLLLDIADEFIDSVTNFGCHLAKHRGGDTLEVRDLQLHLGACSWSILSHALGLISTRRTQPQHSHSWFRIGYDAHRAVPGRHGARHPERTKHKEGCSRHAELASCASSCTGGTG